MLKLFSEVLVVGGEPSLELSCVNKLVEKRVGVIPASLSQEGQYLPVSSRT